MGLMYLCGRTTVVFTLSPDTPESLPLMTPVKSPFTRSFSSLRPVTFKKNSVIRLIALPRTVEFRYVRSVCGPMSVLWTGVSFTLPLVVITWILQDPGIPFSN